MSSSHQYDVAIIGGGIVGLATAMALVSSTDLRIVVLEGEDRLAAHQTGHNSGVIHSGLYYKPGSLKAQNCVEGREAMYRFCVEQGVPHERCGKIVVATSSDELTALDELARRGIANGLQGIERLDADGIRRHEPHATGIAGLFVPDTGVVNFGEAARAMGRVIQEAGAEIRTNARLRGCRAGSDGLQLQVGAESVKCRFLVNCAGLQSDRVARMCGVEPGVRIVPFRGEYYELRPERRDLVNHAIYPVPDPRFPFLGVHFTRMVDGTVEAGPNAVLALDREGYGRWSLSMRDSASIAGYGGFWRLARKFWKTGAMEMARSMSRELFVRALQKLVPELRSEDVRRGGVGVRAQAVDHDGRLVDDFRILQADRMVHVVNAPSPAATASISIGRTVADTAIASFGIK